MDSCEGVAADPVTDELAEERFFSRTDLHGETDSDEEVVLHRSQRPGLQRWVAGAVAASAGICALAFVMPGSVPAPAPSAALAAAPPPEAEEPLRSRPIAQETIDETAAASAALSSARLEDAIRSAARAVAVDPRLSESWRILADAYRKSGRAAAALQADAGCRTFARVGTCPAPVEAREPPSP